MPIDPFLAPIAKELVQAAKDAWSCDVCGKMQAGGWEKWVCCEKCQCRSCAAVTKNRNKCTGCGNEARYR